MPELFTNAQQQGSIAAPSRYSVYVYHHPESLEAGKADWEQKAIYGNVQQALRYAQRLHQSHHYKKIEIKKRVFEPKYDCYIDKTMRVLSDEYNKSAGWKNFMNKLMM